MSACSYFIASRLYIALAIPGMYIKIFLLSQVMLLIIVLLCENTYGKVIYTSIKSAMVLN